MRTLSADLATHLAKRGGVPMALCALVQWNDADATASPPVVATTLGFTSWDRDLIYDAGDGEVVYVAGLGMSVSKVQGNSDGKVDSLEAKVLLGRAEVTTADLIQGRWRGATIKLFLVNPEDLTMGHVMFHDGTLGQTTTDRGFAVAEFLGLLQRYLSTIGEVVTSTCQNVFAGPIDSRGRGCGLNLADYTYAGEVTAWSAGNLVLDSDDLNGFDDNTFNEGIITFDDEPWIAFGIVRSLQADGRVQLKQSPPFTITAGMTFTISQGCSKEFSMCTERYSNGPRFRGFPHLKGTDKMLQVGSK